MRSGECFFLTRFFLSFAVEKKLTAQRCMFEPTLALVIRRAVSRLFAASTKLGAGFVAVGFVALVFNHGLVGWQWKERQGREAW